MPRLSASAASCLVHDLRAPNKQRPDDGGHCEARGCAPPIEREVFGSGAQEIPSVAIRGDEQRHDLCEDASCNDPQGCLRVAVKASATVARKIRPIVIHPACVGAWAEWSVGDADEILGDFPYD